LLKCLQQRRRDVVLGNLQSPAVLSLTLSELHCCPQFNPFFLTGTLMLLSTFCLGESKAQQQVGRGITNSPISVVLKVEWVAIGDVGPGHVLDVSKKGELSKVVNRNTAQLLYLLLPAIFVTGHIT